jgi:hypothetical protein
LYYGVIYILLGGKNMLWLGIAIGFVVGIALCVAVLAVCCKIIYGSRDTFESMVDVVVAAAENRESVVQVYHDGEVLEEAVFPEQ